MGKLGFGIIGCGGMGASLARGLGEIDAAEIVTVFDEAQDKAGELAESTGACVSPSLDDLLADDGVQAVVVAAPQFAHAESTIAAAKAGKHVFCEKPMAVTLADCDAMIEACAAAGVKLMIGQVCRYHGVHGKVKGLVASGELGKPICMMVHRIGGPWGGDYNQHWRLSREMSGGTLLEINAHEIDFMRWVCGDVASVYAAGGIYLDKRLDYPDLALVTMNFASGAKGMLHQGQVSAIGGYGGRVDCEGGSLHFPFFWGGDGGIHICRTGEEATFLPASEIQVETPVTHELRDFVGCVLDGSDVPVPGQEGRAVVEIGIAAYRSIDEGRPIDLPLS
ncbi:MAG: Gfo/Idh/MocA family oxidoreductase [Candidatus Brocadiae bacterium]|nr:Gfo/Idh/MocA family oxidoreductase [Candidatus Brocadiia bacterium]